MRKSPDIMSVLESHLADAGTGWSVGAFGAIAEYTRDGDEPVAMHRSEDMLLAVTDRGGIRLCRAASMRLVASEGVTKESWSQRVAVCLPEDQSAMHRRSTMTELGPDSDALRDRDRRDVLFDLGLETPQVDVCVRIADAAIAQGLRALCGRPIFEHGNPAMSIILAANPNRVFISKLGRVEVFQPIPPPDGKSPDGPHTHVLPKLLRNGLTHSATEPIPQGWVPCAHFYPAHPAKDGNGKPRRYDPAAHVAFQELIGAYGLDNLVQVKAQVMKAVSAGEAPTAFTIPSNRFARATVRVGLRQLEAAGGGGSLASWRAVHDKQHLEEAAAEDPIAHGHQ